MAQDPESRRLILQHKLVALLGSSNVYFQPPNKTMLKYPCFIYRREATKVFRADDKGYLKTPKYTLMYVTKNPDDPMIDRILDEFEHIEHDRFFVQDNLNQHSYTLYF